MNELEKLLSDCEEMLAGFFLGKYLWPEINEGSYDYMEKTLQAKFSDAYALGAIAEIIDPFVLPFPSRQTVQVVSAPRTKAEAWALLDSLGDRFGVQEQECVAAIERLRRKFPKFYDERPAFDAAASPHQLGETQCG